MRTVNPERVETRRRSILEAAQGCFRAKGFHGTSVADICAAADISPGGLYRYFSSKEEIIAAMAQEERCCVANLLQEVATADDFLVALDALFTQMVDHCTGEGQAALAAELMAEAVRNRQFADVARRAEAQMLNDIAEMLGEAQSRGFIDDQLDVREAASLLLAVADGLGLRLVVLGGFEAEQAVAALRGFMGRYLRACPSGAGPIAVQSDVRQLGQATNFTTQNTRLAYQN